MIFLAAASAALSACLVDLIELSGRVCDNTNPCAEGQICRSGRCSPRPRWLSGVAGIPKSSAVGDFANWRGRSLEIGGTWSDQKLGDQTSLRTIATDRPSEWGGWSGPLDVAIGGIYKLDQGDTWQNAASGKYVERWKGVLQKMKSYRAGSGTTYIRFAAQFNESEEREWVVTESEVADFLASWRWFHELKVQCFPEAKLVWP